MKLMLRAAIVAAFLLALAASPALASKIAFERDQDIWIMDADGSHQTRLTSGLGNYWNQSPALSADGSKVAFSSNRDGSYHKLYVMNADGSQQHRIANPPGIAWTPSFSPDGRQIAFTGQTDFGNLEIHVVNADGSGTPRVVVSDHRHNISPVFATSPAYPNSLTYVTAGTFGGVSNSVLATATLGGRASLLTSTDHSDYDPAYSPNGNLIAFARVTGSDQREIYTMEIDADGQRRVTSENRDAGRPTFSPDGRSIAFQSIRGGSEVIRVISVRGGKSRRIANGTYPSWGPTPMINLADLSGTEVPPNAIQQVPAVQPPGAAHRPLTLEDYLANPAYQKGEAGKAKSLLNK